ncbi:MAG: hypothetical protein MnENMB40S_32480 [Rhizobiaceae bacterium MnEN-MB40S]|nr:MAG: hypothetical protein MnENMB40S_32480 [Rhizobiaceae bacterium MnEN-MB40S]
MFQIGRRGLVATAAIAALNLTALTTLPAIAQDDVFELRVSGDTNLQTSRTAHLAVNGGVKIGHWAAQK